MSFSIGIIGLPNAGKSTLFKALTKKQVEIAPYVFSTKEPNIGMAAVPDERLQKIAQIIKPEKTTPAAIKFVDIAGLVKNAHKGEGLGNQFLSHIRNCDAVVEVVRAFKDDKIEHIEGSLDPKRDIAIIKTELLMKDLETLEKQKEEKQKELKRIKQGVSEGKLISEIDLTEEEKRESKAYQFLTAKPKLFVLNCSENQASQSRSFLNAQGITLDLKLEQELSELTKEEIEEFGLKSELDKLILACYNLLELITFFTITGGKETRAWSIKKGHNILKAAELVHSDFLQNFIKAEVIPWQKLVQSGAWTKAREMGLLNTVGKDYLVQDGDVIEFKI